MSKKPNIVGGAQTSKPKLRHEAGPGMSLTDLALLAIFVTSLILVPMALFAMSEERGPAASLKYVLVGFAAAGAAYGVNKYAVDRLAPLHAIGFKLAGLLAVVGILATGSGTALGSLTGIVFGPVETKTYQAAGQELEAAIRASNDAVLIAERIVPSVKAVSEDIALNETCEIQSSCLSGRGNGGRGPMSRALGGASAQAASIAQALSEGREQRNDLLDDLNDLSAEYNAVLSSSGETAAKRRADLQNLHSEVLQMITALREAMPLGVVQGYVAELQGGASLSGDPSGTRRLSAYLRSHGDVLAEQLDDLPESEIALPTFPDRPGMMDVLRHLPTFLAIAAIVIVGELVLPLTLYLTAFFRLRWEIERMEDEPTPPEDDDGFGGLLDHLPKKPGGSTGSEDPAS